MPKAIRTIYNRDGKFRAVDDYDGHSITRPKDYGVDDDVNHRRAAEALYDKMDWPKSHLLIGGYVKPCVMTWVLPNYGGLLDQAVTCLMALMAVEGGEHNPHVEGSLTAWREAYQLLDFIHDGEDKESPDCPISKRFGCVDYADGLVEDPEDFV